MQAIALLHPHHPPTFRLLVSTYSKKLGCGIAAAKNATDHSRCIHAAFTKGSAGNSEAYVRTLNNVVLQVVANSTWTTDQGQWPYLRSCGESWQHRRRTRQDSRDRISPLRRGFERVSRSGSRSLNKYRGLNSGMTSSRNCLIRAKSWVIALCIGSAAFSVERTPGPR